MDGLTYHQRIHAKYAEEHPDYFSCGRRSVQKLIEKAEEEAKQLLKEFSLFYTGDIGIVITAKQHITCWSIAATLTVNGEAIKTEDPCDLLFLELNELMMKRMIQSGMVSFGKEAVVTNGKDRND